MPSLSIKIGFALVPTIMFRPGCIRPKGNQSSSQHKSFQFHRGKDISTTTNHCLSVCQPSNEGGAAFASNGAELL
jgi:hypothetical protein